MSRSSLGKKLQPVRKAWKRLTNALHSKPPSLNIPKTIKTTANRVVAFCSHYFFVHFNRRSLTKPSYHGGSSQYKKYKNLYQYRNRNQLYKNFSPIYIDQLYAAEAVSGHAMHFQARGETSRGKEVVADEDKGRQGEDGMDSMDEVWRAIVAKSPQLQVDEKAEEFIHKFHEDIKIQKERSNLEFQEMLARGA